MMSVVTGIWWVLICAVDLRWFVWLLVGVVFCGF